MVCGPISAPLWPKCTYFLTVVDLSRFQLQINELNVFQIQSVLTDDIW